MQALRTLSAGLLAASLIVGLGACSDDDEPAASPDTGSTSSAEPAPEDVRASDAEVAQGLNDIKTFVQDIASYVTSDNQRAADQQERIEPTWARIEGTVKANAQDAYLTFEDQFAVLENAVTNSDKAKADSASALVATTADDYLDEHPGAGSASPAPTGSASPSPSPSPSAS